MKKTVSNESGLSLEIIRHSDLKENESTYPFLGGDSNNPSWEEYVNDFKQEYKGHILLLRKSIEENNMIGYTGEDADDLWFKFSDGEIWGFTWRAWGDLMSAIVDKKEGYMAYYM
jgi:hypothetical protein